MTDRSGVDEEDLHVVGTTAELRKAGRVRVEVDGVEIAVFEVDGSYYALSNTCVHQGGPMCKGHISGALETDDDFELHYRRDNEIVSCPWHGWEFDIETGFHLAPTGYRLPVFEVITHDDMVLIRF